MKLELSKVESPFVMELVNETGNICVLDANPSIGGLNKGFRPMELLAGSLAGCASIDVLLILRKQRIEPEHYKVKIGTTRKEGVPAPFDSIHLTFEFDESVDEDRARKAIDMSLEKYCSVSASLSKDIEITYDVMVV
jgi:putative redox protein